MSWETQCEVMAQHAMQNVRIPLQPDILRKVHALLQQDVPDVLAIGRLISRDTGLCALVLRAANSPHLGVLRQVASVQHGIALLGLNVIVNLVAGMALRQTLEKDFLQPTPWYWDAAPREATLCARVSRTLRLGMVDVAYTVGLFHDCGVPLLMQKYPQHIAVLDRSHPDLAVRRTTELEEMLMGTNHAVAGYLLTKSWNLDPVIRRIVLMHHDVVDAFSEGIREPEGFQHYLVCLKLAERLYRTEMGAPDDPEWHAVCGLICDFLHMSEPDLDDLCDRMLDATPVAAV